jgi:hypothetical protein
VLLISGSLIAFFLLKGKKKRKLSQAEASLESFGPKQPVSNNPPVMISGMQTGQPVSLDFHSGQVVGSVEFVGQPVVFGSQVVMDGTPMIIAGDPQQEVFIADSGVVLGSTVVASADVGMPVSTTGFQFS